MDNRDTLRGLATMGSVVGCLLLLQARRLQQVEAENASDAVKIKVNCTSEHIGCPVEETPVCLKSQC